MVPYQYFINVSKIMYVVLLNKPEQFLHCMGFWLLVTKRARRIEFCTSKGGFVFEVLIMYIVDFYVIKTWQVFALKFSIGKRLQESFSFAYF